MTTGAELAVTAATGSASANNRRFTNAGFEAELRQKAVTPTFIKLVRIHLSKIPWKRRAHECSRICGTPIPGALGYRAVSWSC